MQLRRPDLFPNAQGAPGGRSAEGGGKGARLEEAVGEAALGAKNRRAKVRRTASNSLGRRDNARAAAPFRRRTGDIPERISKAILAQKVLKLQIEPEKISYRIVTHL